MPQPTSPYSNFNSRSPCGERPTCRICVVSAEQFQLTLPVWGATAHTTGFERVAWISTHAPRVGSDTHAPFPYPYPINFNSRSPCGERLVLAEPSADRLDFNSRSPCGERRWKYRIRRRTRNFNSRSPCGERPRPMHDSKATTPFQLTLPVWGATQMHTHHGLIHLISTHAPRVGSDKHAERRGNKIGISTHAPRVGSDLPRDANDTREKHFNSRSPCGERHSGHDLDDYDMLFQLTLPVWGAISDYETGFVPPKFQLTLPVWGADAMPYEPVRSPISTHAPRVGSARRFFKPVSS